MDNNKDILNMRLEDETFLNTKPNFGQNLIGLHDRGIYTLRDFIYMDLKTISNTATRNEFFRLIDILKYKYLGEDLVCDVLLYRKYSLTYQEYVKSNEDSPHFEEDFFVTHMLRVFERDCKTLGIPFLRSRFRSLFNSQYRTQFFHGAEVLPMLDYLEDERIKNSHAKYLVNFYLEYIRTKAQKNEEAITSVELESLKMQLSSLTSQRDDLDKQIEDVKVQIQIISEGKNNARK